MPYKDKEQARAYARSYAEKNRVKIAENSNKPERKEKRIEYLRRYNSDPEKKKLEALRKALHYKRNKDAIVRRVAVRREETAKLIMAIQAHYGCMNLECKWVGVYDSIVLDFHHCDPSDKKKDVPGMLHYSRRVLAKEINKCALLCCNCHRLAHNGRVVLRGRCNVNENLCVIKEN